MRCKNMQCFVGMDLTLPLRKILLESSPSKKKKNPIKFLYLEENSSILFWNTRGEKKN